MPITRLVPLILLVSSSLIRLAAAQQAVEVCDLDPTGSSSPALLTNCWGNTLVFRASTPGTGSEPFLWTRAGGCKLLADLDPGELTSAAQAFTCVGNSVYFSATIPNVGTELVAYDGARLVVFDLNKSGSGLPTGLTTCSNKLFFAGHDSVNNRELWVADPVSGKAEMVADLYSGSNGSSPSWLTCFKGMLVFTATAPTIGNELWQSDGTGAGTHLVKDILEGLASSSPHSLVACRTVSGKELLFLSATTVATGHELHVYDGRDVSLVKDIRSGPAASGPTGTVSCTGRVYFFADDGLHGLEPWVSDGTAAGTMLLKDVYPGPTGSSGTRLTCCGDKVYFRAVDGTSGAELWVTDGSTAGTVLVKDILPGSGSSLPDYLTAVGTRLYFSANDGTLGTELWLSDGSTAGTRLVTDINPGAPSSSPQSLTNCAGELFLSAIRADHGRELWRVVDPGAMVEVLGLGCDGIQLRATPAALGKSFVLDGWCAPVGRLNPSPPHDGYLGVTFLALAARDGFMFHDPKLLAPSCWAWSILFADVLLLDTVSLTAQWSSSPKFVPSAPALKGVKLVFQSFYVDLKTVVPQKTSNVVQLTIG